VASNVGAMGELVSSDNIGLAVEPGAVEPLATAVIKALDDLDKFQSRYGPEIESKYGWEHIAELTMRSYEAAININRE
jgi:glycosyltransferase involved in cell wall biosynthesis